MYYIHGWELDYLHLMEINGKIEGKKKKKQKSTKKRFNFLKHT